jgi:hypothetical protein
MFITAKPYCDQPIISETTRCESDDFIQTIDQDKMLWAFMCEGKKGEKSYLAERKRRGSVRESLGGRGIAWV